MTLHRLLPFVLVTIGLVGLSACDEPPSSGAGDEPLLADAPPLDAEIPTAGKADGFEFIAGCPGYEAPYVDFDTFEGLDGTYVRAAAPVAGEPHSLTFDVDFTEDIRVGGTYWANMWTQNFLFSSESGEFAGIGPNPAIGSIFSFDSDADLVADRFMYILGLKHSAFTGKVRSLCVISVETDTTQGEPRPFLLVRSSF